MRSNGATSARVGDVALTLGSPIAPVTLAEQPVSPPQEETPAQAMRRDLEELLHSSGADVEAFMPRDAH